MRAMRLLMTVVRKNNGETTNMKTSNEGISLIKKFEGLETTAYRCSANVLTIGYGHTKGVQEGDEWSEAHAEDVLRADLVEFEGYIHDMVNVPLEQCQLDALVAWCFNIGPANAKSSSAIRLLNEGRYEEVPASMRLWNKATVNGEKIVLEGLVRRRNAESMLFMGKDWTDI